MICKILRLLGNTLTADDKYSLINRDILTQPIQMHLSQKQETFTDFSPAFSKSILFFEYFLEKDDSYSPYISEFTDFEKRGQINI